ncbi:MAG: rolling circle replication-associated protein, partial [Minisyncoccia bacterium]
MVSKSMYAVKTFLKSGKASNGMLFLTLTFAENVSSDRAQLTFKRFLQALNRYYESNFSGRFGYPKKLRYFAVRELQNRGVYHYHLLFIDLRYLPFSL